MSSVGILRSSIPHAAGYTGAVSRRPTIVNSIWPRSLLHRAYIRSISIREALTKPTSVHEFESQRSGFGFRSITLDDNLANTPTEVHQVWSGRKPTSSTPPGESSTEISSTPDVDELYTRRAKPQRIPVPRPTTHLTTDPSVLADSTSDEHPSLAHTPSASGRSSSAYGTDLSNLSSHQRAHGRSCLVTGATSGIGYEVTKRLALEGATHIRIIARDLTRGEEALSRIKAETGRHDMSTTVLVKDLAKIDQVAPSQLYGTCQDQWPIVDTVVLCAGTSQSELLVNSVIGNAREMININLYSCIALSRVFLQSYFKTSGPKAKHVSTAGTGEPASSASTTTKSFCLVSISSLLAHKGGYGASVYAASKLGLIGFNRALSLEAGAIYKRKLDRSPIAPAFRVNTVSPGYIDTPMTSGITGTGKESLENQIPLGRFGKPEEVADAVMFLVGNEYANNCDINLDGGLSAT